MSSAEVVLAIDVGGTKLAAGVLDADGKIRRRGEVPSQPVGTGEADALWLTLLDLVDGVCDGEIPAAVGVGCGGPLRWPAGVVSPLNIPAWRDFPLRDRLRDRFPGTEVRLVNDAIAVAIGEHWQGAGAGMRNVLGVVVSTGVGGGLVLDGKVVYGATGNAGHLGHVVVDPSGPHCSCGGRGCLEAIARGPAIVRWACDQGWMPADGGPADGRTLAADARRGDPVPVAALDRCGHALGVALASATHLLELDLVAIGGGIALAGDLLLAPAQAAFECHARMEFAARCRIVAAGLGQDAGLIGAGALVMCGDRYWPAGAD
jgi:glucokinase